MKKTVLLALIMTSLLSARSDKEEVIDHSANLTSSFKLSSGTRIIFDWDQCSRFGFVGGAACGIKMLMSILTAIDTEEKFGAGSSQAEEADYHVLKWFAITASVLVIPKVVANLVMAKKELDRGEGARALDHTPIFRPLVQWYLLLTQKQANDRKAWNRIGWALMPLSGIGILIYVVNEPCAFFYDLSDGKWPISIE